MTTAKNIDAVAQSPSGMQFAFKNGKSNKIYIFDQSSSSLKLITDCDPRDEPVAVAMPEENLIYTAWRSKAKLVFRKIILGAKKPEIQEQDLRNIYDGCKQRDSGVMPL
jgi:hypothetical protein